MRKKKPPEHVNHERWLVSYADFITLLFAFFTTMYAISTVDAQKSGKMVFSMRQAFNLDFFPSEKAILGLSNPDEPPLPYPHGPKQKFLPGIIPKPAGGMVSRTRERTTGNDERFRSLAEQIDELVQMGGLGDKVQIRMEARGMVISLSEAGFFDSGSAEVRSDSLPVIDSIAAVLRRSGQQLRIEGHSDDRPTKGGRYRSNWDISTARAVGVVQLLIDRHRFSPAVLSAAGYSSHRPIDTNETAEGRARNRRVDLILLSESARRQEPPPLRKP